MRLKSRLIACRSLTIFVSTFAVVGLLMEKRNRSIRLEDVVEEYSDEVLPGREGSEKM